MPSLTITYGQFEAAIRRDRPRFRNSRLRKVLALLEQYPHDHRIVDQLAEAVRNWYRCDPKEFKNRDALSGGLCTQLFQELGLTPVGPLELKDSAFEIVATNSYGNRRPDTKSTYLGSSIEDYMQFELSAVAAKTAVVVIDMQNADVGFERHGEMCVEDHQAAVLDIANELKMNVFEIRIVRRAPEFKIGLTNDPTISKLRDRMPAKDRHVQIEKPYFSTFEGTNFATDLNDRGIKNAVVMGFDANTCVANTIFGKPQVTDQKNANNVTAAYVPGLLDRGIRVITARCILASDNATLEESYGVRV